MSPRPSLKEVLAGLQAEAHLGPDAEARARSAMEVHQRTAVATPWFVKALAGFGAWVASAFLISFFSCMGLMRAEAVMVICGLALCGATTALRRKVQGAFPEQLAMALCLSGAGMTCIGFAEGTDSEHVFAAVLLVLSAVLLAVFPDAILRFLATLGVAGAAVFLLGEAVGQLGRDLGMLAFTALLHLLLLDQARLRAGRWSEQVGPASFALACGLPVALLLRGVPRVLGMMPDSGVASPTGLLTLGLTAVTLYTAARVMRELELEASGLAGVGVFAALGLVALMTLHTPAVIAAVGMMVLGFHRRSAVLLGLAIAFLLAAGSWYYYDLGLTLLAKALALAGSGLVFLGLRLFLLRRFPAQAAEVR
jgi:hypothetical protein